VPEWIGVFRQRHRLDAVIGAWISSGEVGVRPPHPALLRAAWRATGFAPEHALVIARSLPLLDVAAAQGARTVQYAPEDDPAGGVHPVLRSFGRVST
jgi:FMN phosphatase YigB (HAD superfamily)